MQSSLLYILALLAAWRERACIAHEGGQAAEVSHTLLSMSPHMLLWCTLKV